jgi:hypothetical protein
MKNKNIISSRILIIFVMFAVAVVSVNASIGEVSLSLINQNPNPAIAGGVVELRIGVQNNGDDTLENLTVEFIPGYPFQIAPGEEVIQDVGIVGPYQGYSDDTNIKVVKFKLILDSSATAGSYDLNFKSYAAGSSDAVTKTLTIDLKNRENAEIIYIDKTVLVPGKQTSMTFTINNVGNSPLRDLTFSWENDDMKILPVGSDNTKYVKYIGVGESSELEYEVIADTNTDPGLYKLDLTLNYDDSISGQETTVSTIAGVYVGGGTDFDIALSETSSSSTSFSVANIGSNPAYSVSVIIPEQDGWKVTGANSMIIGNLNTGDYTVASFTLQSAQSGVPSIRGTNNASQSTTKNVIKLQIAYTDTMGSRETVEKSVPLSSQSFANSSMTGMSGDFRRQNQTSSLKYVWYGIGAIALLVLIFLYVRYKRQKIINPNLKLKDLFKKQSKKK